MKGGVQWVRVIFPTQGNNTLDLYATQTPFLPSLFQRYFIPKAWPKAPVLFFSECLSSGSWLSKLVPGKHQLLAGVEPSIDYARHCGFSWPTETARTAISTSIAKQVAFKKPMTKNREMDAKGKQQWTEGGDPLLPGAVVFSKISWRDHLGWSLCLKVYSRRWLQLVTTNLWFDSGMLNIL